MDKISFKDWRDLEFKGVHFSSQTIKSAGKSYAAGNIDKAKKILFDNIDSLGTIRPPAKCNIVASSKPILEMDISKTNKIIQEYIYNLSFEQRQKCNPGTSETDHKQWLIDNNVTIPFQFVSYLNKIFSNSLNIYDGVIKKVKNRNEKKAKKIKNKNLKREENGLDPIVAEEESAFDKDGYLINKPGVNYNLYATNNSNVHVLDPSNKKDIILIEKLNKILNINYTLLPNKSLPIGKSSSGSVPDRYSIKAGDQGHIPQWQVYRVNKNKKRIRRRVDKEIGIILGILRFGEDWIAFDLRGLLRSIRYRGVSGREITGNQILSFFSKDPVINPVTNEVIFVYSEGKLSTKKSSEISFKKAPIILKEMLMPFGKINCLTFDLGVTNPLSVKCSELSLINDNIIIKEIKRSIFGKNDSWEEEIKKLKESQDNLEKKIKDEAFKLLPENYQSEIKKYELSRFDFTKKSLLEKYNLSENEIDWKTISFYSSQISKILEKKSNPQSHYDAIIKSGKNKGKIQKKRRSDQYYIDQVKYKLDNLIRNAWNQKIWDLKRSNKEYNKISIRKKELCRNIINTVLIWGNNPKVLILEDLNLPLFHGTGKKNNWMG